MTKAVRRQLTAKGREALAQRPKGEANDVEQADNTVEQTVTGSIDEVKDAVRRGGQKVKATRQKKQADIKERRAAQTPQKPGNEPPATQEPPTIRERPQQIKQGEQAKVHPEARSQQPQADPQGRPKELKRTAKERQPNIIPQRSGEPRAAKPSPRTKATAPELRSKATPPKPEAYQGKMRQAAVQQHREQVICQKAKAHPELPAARSTPDRPEPPRNPQTSTGRSTPPPAKQTTPTQPGGSRSAIWEKVKAAAPKEKPPRGKTVIKTRQQVERLGGKTPAKPGKRVTKAVQKQAQQQMKRHSQRKLIQQAQKAAKAAANVTRKVAVAIGKAVAAAFSAIAGIVGGGVLLVALCVILLVAAVVSSPFGIFFSNEDPAPGAVTTREVVAEVNAEYAAKIETLQAGNYDSVEMNGAPADWRDVLAVFAVKTAGADDGIDVATLDPDRAARLKTVFWDMTTISSHVQTIRHPDRDPDDGVDTSWTERILQITVTGKTADEAAAAYGFTPDQHDQLAELKAPENSDLWLSLLYGISGTDGQIVSVALSQVGNVGGQPYWSWYGFNSHVEWCACFVSWCANECGHIDAGTIPKFAGCVQGSRWFKSRGQWADGSIEPVPGMIIFFDWDNKGSSGPQDGVPDHVGIVVRVENGVVYTVEGNSGDACRENRYPVRHYEIYGYGVPSY